MTEHNLFYYPYASFTNAQLPLLKVAALYFDKLVLLDPVGASWDTVGADHVSRDAVRLLKEAGILEIVTPATVLAKYERPIAEAIRRDMEDREFLDLCDAQGQASGKQRWTLSLAKVPRDVQTDQTMRHLMGDFAREVARDSGQYRERAGGNPSEYYEYAETGQAYDEYREGDNGDVEYRYADFRNKMGSEWNGTYLRSHKQVTTSYWRKPASRIGLSADDIQTLDFGLRRNDGVNEGLFLK